MSLPVVVENGKVSFPWFPVEDLDAEYQNFCIEIEL